MQKPDSLHSLSLSPNLESQLQPRISITNTITVPVHSPELSASSANTAAEQDCIKSILKSLSTVCTAALSPLGEPLPHC